MLIAKQISVRVEDEASNGDKEILKDVSLTLEDGRFIVITGPNGGGKSTLAKVIAGIETPAGGSLTFDGQDITHLDMTGRAKLGIGYAFQQPVRFKGLTVRDLVGMAAGGELDEKQLCSYLFDVGLCAHDYIDREVNASLSGGEIKRIEIAMAMARKCRLTIFDEPEAGIDLWSFQNLIGVFQNMMKARDTYRTIVVISHQERILEIADEIIVLAGGEVVRRGPRAEVLPALLKTDDTCVFCPKQKGEQA